MLLSLLDENCIPGKAEGLGHGHPYEKFDIHILTKALYVLRTQKCNDWLDKKLLYYSSVLDRLDRIMRTTQMSTTREAS